MGAESYPVPGLLQGKAGSLAMWQQLAEANAAKAAEVTEAAVKVLAVGKAG